MDAAGALTPESPVRTRRSERGRKMAFPTATTSAFESSRNDQPTPKAKRRNQVGDKSSVTSSSGSSLTDGRRKPSTNQAEEQKVSRAPPGLELAESPVKQAAYDANRLKRREVAGETKVSSRSSSARRNSSRGADKAAATTRRQVYREKQVKETPKESASPVESTEELSPSKSEASTEEHIATPTRAGKQKDASPKKVPASPAKALVPPETTESPTVASGLKEESASTAPTAGNDVGDEASELAADSATDEVQTNEPEPGAEHRLSTSTGDGDMPGGDDATEDSQQDSREDSPRSERNSSPFVSSESDAERLVGSTEQQPSMANKKSKRKATASPAAVSNGVSPTAYPEATPQREPQPAPTEKKHVKESRKDRSKKDKADKKKATRGKKDKRGSSLISKAADALNDSTSEAQDMLLEALASTSTPLSTKVSKGLREGITALASAGLLALLSSRRGCVWLAGRLNIKGVLATTFTYVESVLAVAFSVVLLLSLHVASWFIRIHRMAFRAVLTHRHIGFCFGFLYMFPFLVQYVFPWAPPWAPVCLWYAFLVQLFCTNGPTAMVTTFRIILPLVFLVEGISHHSFLLDLNGAELLLASFIISALKTSNLCSPIFFLSLATQCLLAVFLGSELVVQWLQLALALYSLHVMAATEDEWAGVGEEEDELACHSASLHHSIADYNHPAPSSAVSIQKTKRLDRRALAYVRGRKLR